MDRMTDDLIKRIRNRSNDLPIDIEYALDELADEVERLRTTLEYYAYYLCEYNTDCKICGTLSEDVCGGCKARAALKK